MADDELMVTISGAALSLLFYENARSRGDQMGFFLGEVLSFVTKNVTDSERQVESVKVHVDIQSVVKCSSTDQIYESSGKIDEERLRDFIRDKGKNVVGWFRFRRNSTLVPTLRDKIMHRQFLSIFRDSSNQINENYFVCCMLNASLSLVGGTHKFKHVFLHYKQGVYHPIPLRINNLGHDASRHDGSDYKPTPVKNSNEPDAFTKFVNSLNLDLTRTPGIESIRKIQKATEEHLQKLIPLVVQTDQEVAELEKLVEEGRNALVEKLWEKDIKMKEESTTEPKYKPRREREKVHKNAESTSSLKEAFMKNKESSSSFGNPFIENEESTSRGLKIQDDLCLKKESTFTLKQKSRYSMPASVGLSPIEQVRNPFNKTISYSQVAKKIPERSNDDSNDDPDC